MYTILRRRCHDCDTFIGIYITIYNHTEPSTTIYIYNNFSIEYWIKLVSPSEVVDKSVQGARTWRRPVNETKQTMNSISNKDENVTYNYQKTTNALSSIDEDHPSSNLSQRLRFGSTHRHIELSRGALNTALCSSLEKKEERAKNQMERKWRLMYCL